MSATPTATARIPADLDVLGRPALETLCAKLGFRVPLGAGTGRLRALLSQRRDTTPTVQAPAPVEQPAPAGQNVGPVEYDAKQTADQTLRAKCRELGLPDGGVEQVLAPAPK